MFDAWDSRERGQERTMMGVVGISTSLADIVVLWT